MPESLDGVLLRAGENRYARDKPAVPEHIWRAAVGHRIAERATPVGLERGVLTVRVATAAWSSELSLLSDALIERLQAEGVTVQELRFRVGQLTAHQPVVETRASREVPPPAPLPRELAAAVERVADPELREVLASAAKANLAWQKK